MKTSTIVFLAIIILGILVVMLTLRAQRLRPNKKKEVSGVKKNRSSPKRAPLPRNKYRAVSIKSHENSCAPVKAIGTRRFLVEDKETPQLPLPDCDFAQCACIYVHHEDQREPELDRRALGVSLQTQLYDHSENDERRKRRGRRASDWE